MTQGPLTGITVVEFAASFGPAEFTAMLLSDMGATVIRIDRKGVNKNHMETGYTAKFDPLKRGRRWIAFDLKKPEAVEASLKLVENADIILEGFRPGVMERLGLGPDICLKRNPKIVYGRLTGWGQYGPLSKAAGHDINYISLSGALHAIGPGSGKPVTPLSLVGDIGGGALFLATGVLAAYIESKKSGRGQVVDAAMCDGATSMLAPQFAMTMAGIWDDKNRQSNQTDGGAPNYDIYETKDGKYISIGSLEPNFYALLRKNLNLTDDFWNGETDKSKWPEMKEKITAAFKTKTRDEWCALMEGTDACFAPVLRMSEAPEHPHNKAREIFTDVDGVTQPNVAPRFSVTPSKVQSGAFAVGAHNEEVLKAAGFSADELDALKKAEAI